MIERLRSGRGGYKKLREQEPVAERSCKACDGTGFSPVKASRDPTRRVYAPRCAKCGGKGRIAERSTP